MTTRPSSSNSRSEHSSRSSTDHSPRSDYTSSLDDSPSVIPKIIRSSSEGGSSSPPARSPPFHHRLSLDMGRPSSAAGKGGCWTCRLRRKKCDEVREDDSCQTCRRLQLKCLGWGAKRPEWMRDKEAVAQYKAEIKAHLLKLGLIRGQPRSNFIQSQPSISTGSSAPSGMVHHPGGELQSFHRDQAGLGFGQHPHGPYGLGLANTPPLDMSFQTSAMADPHLFELTPTVASTAASYGHSAASTPFDFASPASVPNALLGTPAGTQLSLPSMTTASTSDFLGLNAFSPESEHQHHQQQRERHQARTYQYDVDALRIPSDPGADEGSLRRDHINYYFETVKGMQYLFSTKSALDTLYTTLTTEEPPHSLTNSVCALAGLHYSRAQRSSTSEHADSNLAHFFYTQAAYPLASSRGLSSHVTEYDALTALHLVSYSLASVGGKVNNGVTGWGSMADVAIDWLTQTNMHADASPRETLSRMSPSAAFAVRATMCIDIFSSIAIKQPPRLLALYRRLLSDSSGSGGWSSASASRRNSTSSIFTSPLGTPDTGVEQLVVCGDSVLLALAETAALAHWKAQESRSGSLSMRELIARGNAIERTLSQQAGTTVAASILESGGDMGMGGRTSSPGMMGLGLMGLPTQEEHTFETNTNEDSARRLVAAIYHEAASMYLNLVLSGCNPGVPEIATSANTIIHLLQRLPVTNFDRALLLPLLIAGSMMEGQQQRIMIRNRLLRFGDDNANIRQIVGLLLAVWQRRDTSGGRAVDWRDVMQEQSLALLLL